VGPLDSVLWAGAAWACALATAGCSQPSPAPHAKTQAQVQPPAPAQLGLADRGTEATYLPPPQLVDARIGHDGAIEVVGQAAPMAKVTFSTPEGDSFHATADAHGAWVARLPQSGLPRLFAISDTSRQGPVHAEGALVTIPHAAVSAVMVRAGYAALPIGRSSTPEIVSVDYDPGGFAGVSGLAPANSPVRLGIDGLPAGVAQADAQGRFAMLATNRRPGFGVHELEVATSEGVVRRTVMLTPPDPLTRPYTASGAPGSWTVEWALNGGGVQTTLLVAPPRA
jgi:hypothetical protein